MLAEAQSNRILLASGSPRRAELLRQAGVPFVVAPSNVPELVPVRCADVASHITNTALLKAGAAFANAHGDPELAGLTVLAADTTVVLDGRMLGKPADEGQARLMLHALSGRTHQVTTGVCLISRAGVQAFAETTDVTFGAMTNADVDAYIATGEPMDKAGAYGIQGLGGAFVERISGDYYNVVGLPLHRVLAALAALATH